HRAHFHECNWRAPLPGVHPGAHDAAARLRHVTRATESSGDGRSAAHAGEEQHHATGFRAKAIRLRAAAFRGQRGLPPGLLSDVSTTVTVDERLAQLGIALPEPVAPVANYALTRRTGNLLFVSGHVARRDGAVVTGRLGDNL